MRGARQSRAQADSKSQPDARVAAGTRLRNPSNVVNVAFDKPSRRSTKSHARKMERAGRRRAQFWVLILYLITVIGAVVASGVYLLS